MHHLEDRPDPVALLPETVGQGAFHLDLGRGVGAVAELVLEAHQTDGVPPVGQPARHQEAGQPSGRLRERQETVGHRGRAEPLVAGQAVVLSIRLGACPTRPDIGAALLLRHRHAHRGRRFAIDGQERGIVEGGGQAGSPDGVEGRVRTQGRDRGVGHGQRAADRGFDLREHVDQRRVSDVASRRAVRGGGDVAALQPGAHDGVVAPVERYLVQSRAVGAERRQPRRIATGLRRRIVERGIAEPLSGLEKRLGPAAEGQRVAAQSLVRSPRIGGQGRGGLVVDLMGRQDAGSGQHRHLRLVAVDPTRGGARRVGGCPVNRP